MDDTMTQDYHELEAAIDTLEIRLPPDALNYAIEILGLATREQLGHLNVGDSNIGEILKDRQVDVRRLIKQAILKKRPLDSLTGEGVFDLVDPELRQENNPLVDVITGIIGDAID